MKHRSKHRHPRRCSSERQGNWSGLNIAAMVVGFVVFWPLGLFLLYWNISGRDVRDLPNTVRSKWQKSCGFRSQGTASSDNEMFNEYQQTQYDRIDEIKAEITDRARRFNEFRADAKRRKDEKEFKRFMDRAPSVDLG